MKTVFAAAALAGAALVSTNANASYLVQVLGLFGASTPTTAETAANQQFTLALNLADPFTYTVDSYNGHITDAFYNSSYTLSGVDAGSGLAAIAFYENTPGYEPQVDFAFNDGIQLYLDNLSVEKNGTLSAPSMNTVFTYVDPNTGNTIASGSATITITNVADVPEAATWAMMISGFGLVGGALRRSRRTSVSFA